MEQTETFLKYITEWIMVEGIRILVIIVVAFLLVHYSNKWIGRFVRFLVPSGSFNNPESERRREDTLIAVFGMIAKIVIFFIAILIILIQVNIPITPLLAATGLASLALGFGAQYVIRDIISGIFLIIENQFGIGDIISVGEITGVVEHVTLRLVKIRDYHGILHFIPNGEIKMLSNYSKDFANVHLNIFVALDTDLKVVEELVNDVGDRVVELEEYKNVFLEPARFLRVQEFGPDGITIRVHAKVIPSKRWDSEGMLRRELKEEFTKRGVKTPFPQRIIHNTITKEKNGKGK